MTSKYLLSCPCGRDLLISVAQAGERVRCECGTWLSVPSLREMSHLTPAGPHRRPKSTSAWGRRERWILLSALFSTVAWGLFATSCLTRPRLGDPTLLTPAEVWIVWQDLCQGADRRLNPPDEEFLERLQANGLWQRITLATAILSLLFMAAIYAIPRRPVTPAPLPSQGESYE